MNAGSKGFEQRLLILAPIGRDARAAAQLLEAAGVACVICRDLEELCCKLIEGAGGIGRRGGVHTGELQQLEQLGLAPASLVRFPVYCPYQPENLRVRACPSASITGELRECVAFRAALRDCHACEHHEIGVAGARPAISSPGPPL